MAAQKYIEVTFRNGKVYRIPASVIAGNRAKYYYPAGESDPEYCAERDYLLEDDFELVDWAQNNMRWSDLAPHAKLVGNVRDDHEMEWLDPAKLVVVKE